MLRQYLSHDHIEFLQELYSVSSNFVARTSSKALVRSIVNNIVGGKNLSRPPLCYGILSVCLDLCALTILFLNTFFSNTVSTTAIKFYLLHCVLLFKTVTE